MKREEKMMKVAEAISATSDFARIKIGAVIAKKNRVISVGCNIKKTHPLQKKYNIIRQREWDDDINGLKHYIHAEISAIINANENLDGATIYVSRKNKHGELAMCKPCVACMAMIRKVGIKKIVYTDENGLETVEVKSGS